MKTRRALQEAGALLEENHPAKVAVSDGLLAVAQLFAAIEADTKLPYRPNVDALSHPATVRGFEQGKRR